MSTALEYLDYVPGEAATGVAVLKDRIYRSGETEGRVWFEVCVCVGGQ